MIPCCHQNCSVNNHIIIFLLPRWQNNPTSWSCWWHATNCHSPLVITLTIWYTNLVVGAKCTLKFSQITHTNKDTQVKPCIKTNSNNWCYIEFIQYNCIKPCFPNLETQNWGAIVGVSSLHITIMVLSFKCFCNPQSFNFKLELQSTNWKPQLKHPNVVSPNPCNLSIQNQNSTKKNTPQHI